MFHRLPERDAVPARTSLTVSLDGVEREAFVGETVATVLLRCAPLLARFSPVSGAPRAPYCMMGVCFECLLTIDGVPSRQACLTAVAPGMRIERGRAAVLT